MEEVEQQVSNEQPASNEPTLDDVYKQFSVEEEAQQFQPQRRQEAPQQQFQPQHVPDPILQSDEFRRMYGQETTALRQSLHEHASLLTEIQQERAKAKEEADIKKAVDYVNESLKQDPDFVEIALGQKARKDPKFLAIYNNRDRNPRAWDAALKAVRNEFSQKYSVRTDPQLAENQRALRTAQQTSATTSRPEHSGDESRFAGKSGRDFQREWDQYISGGY